MISKKEKPNIKKIHPHTQTDEKNRKIQLSAKTPSNMLTQLPSPRQPLLESQGHCQPLELQTSSPHAATLCNHAAPTEAKTPSPSCRQRPLHPTAPCWELGKQNPHSLFLGAPGQGRGRPVAWEHLLVLGQERLCACLRPGPRHTPKSWTGPEPSLGTSMCHLRGNARLDPEARHPPAARAAASLGNSETASQVLKIRGLMRFTSCCWFLRGENKLFGNSGRLCHFLVRNTCTKFMFSFYIWRQN